MKTLRIELKQEGATLNLNRQFEDGDLRGVTALGHTVAAHLLEVFNASKQFGINTGFKFSKAFELNVHISGQSLNFKQSLFSELGMQGFKVVNTDKSKERLASFIGKMVEQLSFKCEVDVVASEEDVLELAKKTLQLN